MRSAFVLAQAAILAGCMTQPARDVRLPVEYSAIQYIETTPGPFINRIYVAADRERQDASLGGGTVTTIIRRDIGVAWLLIPGKQQYQELALTGADSASVHPRFTELQARKIGEERVDGVLTEKTAFNERDGRDVALAWISQEGIVVKAEIHADLAQGTPEAVITLRQVQLEPQSADLFELPAGYQKLEGK